jgi:hypothetical protein
MGSRIPKPIRLQVMRKWLQGTFRDDIAKELQISQGAVSGIIDDFRRDDSQFDLLREVAVKIKKQGMDPALFAPLVRLYEVLREKGSLTGTTGHKSLELMQNRMEALIVSLDVICFKRNLSIEDLVSLVTNMYDTAGILRVPLDRFPEYIMDLKYRIEVLGNDIDQLETKKQAMLKEYDMTSESLQEYIANKPSVVKIRNLERALTNAEETLKNEKFLNKVREELEQVREELEWSVSENELIKVNSNIGLLKEMVMELYHRPSEYPELIREMMHEYNLRHKGKKLQREGFEETK